MTLASVARRHYEGLFFVRPTIGGTVVNMSLSREPRRKTCQSENLRKIDYFWNREISLKTPRGMRGADGKIEIGGSERRVLSERCNGDATWAIAACVQKRLLQNRDVLSPAGGDGRSIRRALKRCPSRRSSPHPRPLSPKGRGEKDCRQAARWKWNNHGLHGRHGWANSPPSQ